MAMLYDITGHALLSPEAAQLGGSELETYARAAEVLLGLLKIPLFTGDYALRAADAVALQVSYLVESGIEAFILSDQWRGARRSVYRGGARRMPPLHPVAKKIITQIKPRPEGSIGR